MADYNYSDYSKDMIYAISEALSKHQKLALSDIFGDTTGADLIKLAGKLNQLKKELEDKFQDLRKEMDKDFLTEYDKSQKSEDDIFSQIVKLINSQDITKIDIKVYLNNETSLNAKYFSNDQQIMAIQNFATKYQALKEQIIGVQEKLGTIMENVRGDKMQYGILLQLKGGKDAAKMVKLSRAQFDEFEQKNKDLFEIGITKRDYDKKTETWSGSEGTVSNLQLKRGVSADTIYSRMKTLFGADFDQGQDILDQVYAVNKDGMAIKTRDVYKMLFSDSFTKQNTNFQNINAGRKLELLFDSQFHDEIVNYMNSNSLINKKGHYGFDKQNLITQLSNFDTSKYKNGENIYAHATGDVNFKINGQAEAWQLKLKGSYLPWNGQGIDGALNALSILSTLYGVMSNPTGFNNGSYQNAFFNNLGLNQNSFMADPRVQSTISDYAYQSVGDMFQSANNFTTVEFI